MHAYRRWRAPLLVALVSISVLALLVSEEIAYAGLGHVDPLWLTMLIASIAADVAVLTSILYLRGVSRAANRLTNITHGMK